MHVRCCHEFTVRSPMLRVDCCLVEGEGEAEAEAGSGTPRSLEMENARLRAEVATQYAHEAARNLLASDTSHMAASMQRSLQIGDPQV